MNHGLKLLIYSFSIAGAIGLAACLWENAHPPSMPQWFVSCEVHAHHDLAEAIREQAEREREKNDPDGYEREREYEQIEQDSKGDWGDMV